MGRRIWKGALIGTIVYILWMIAFGMIHRNQVGTSEFVDEAAMLEAIEQNTAGSGIYLYPMIPEHATDATKEEKNADDDVFWERLNAGPLVFLEYNPEPTRLWVVLLLELVIVFVVAYIATALLMAVPTLTFWGKALFVMFVASTGGIQFHLENWLEPAFNTPFTLIAIINVVGGWFLAGMAIAKWGVPKQEMLKDRDAETLK